MAPIPKNLQDLCGRPPEHEGAGAECCILMAAIRMFGRFGYVGTSVRAIADAAGVTAPLIGYHFENKEGLFRTCVELVVGGLADTVVAELDGASDLEDFVHRFAAVQIGFSEQHPDALRFALATAYGPEEGQPKVDFISYWAVLSDLVAKRFLAAIEAGEFTPRPRATIHDVVRHLFNIVHLEVFSSYERERYADELKSHEELMLRAADPVADIVHQFFHGAGQLGSDGEEQSS